MPLIVMNASAAAPTTSALPRMAGAAPTTCGHRRSCADLGVVVGDAAVLPDVDVRGGAEDAVAQLALQAGHQRQRDDERHHADRRRRASR